MTPTPTPTPFAAKPTIVGETVVLRPIAATDAAAMWAALHDDEARWLTGTRRRFTRDQIERWAASRIDQDDRLDLAVTERSTGAWAGELAILDWSPEDRSCAFRIALDAAARDRGIGTEATRLVVDHVFEHLPIHRIGLDVFAFNDRARATYAKVGFRTEGVLRDALRWDGAHHDIVLMSILRPEWEALRVGDDVPAT